MKLSIQQEIINFVDENEFVTFSQVFRKFETQGTFAMLAFEELLQDGQIIQVSANKLLGTYKYKLPA